MRKIVLLVSLTIVLAGCETLLKIAQESGNLPVQVPPVNLNVPAGDVINQKMDKILGESSEYIREEFKEKWKEAVTNFSESYDVTDFNYAISFGDNSVPHESKGKIKQAKSLTYYLADPESGQEAPPKVKGQNFNYSGEVLYASSSYNLAEKSFLKAVKIYEDAGLADSAFTSLTISNLGLLYHTTGRYTLAEEYSLNALNRRESLHDKTGYAASLNNLAVLYKDMGKYTQAEEYILKAKRNLEETKSDKTVNFSIVLNNYAAICQMTGKYNDAEKLYIQSIELAGKVIKEKSPTYVRLKVNLAQLYQLLKKFDESEKIYLEAISIKKKRLGTKHPDYAVLLRNTASLYQEMGKYEKVEEYLNQAIEIYKNQFGEEHPAFARSLYEKSLFLITQSRFDEALPLLDKALSIQKIRLGQHHPDITSTNEALAVVHWQKNANLPLARKTYKDALDEYVFQINNYFPAMNDYEKTKFWDKIQSSFIRFYSFGAESYEQIPEVAGDIYNYHIATKALLLNNSRKVKNRILSSGDKELIGMFNKWQDMNGYVARLYTMTKEELSEEQINLDSLVSVVGGLEKEITKRSEMFKQAKDLQSADFVAVSKTLKEKEGALEIVRVQKYSAFQQLDSVIYIALIVKPSANKPEMVVLQNGNSMEKEWAAEYQTAIHKAYKMEKFDNYYWNEIESHLSDIQTLYTSIDGIYNQVNINTIKLSTGDYIVDKRNVYFVTNTKDLLTTKSKNNSSKKAVLFGFPNYQLGIGEAKGVVSPLPGTKAEVEAVQQQLKKKSWQTSVYMGDEATEENLKKVENPSVYHIATHGFYLKGVHKTGKSRAFGIEPMRAASNPLLRSGLLLAGSDKTIQNINTNDNSDADDGILNAFEAMILNLDKTEIVILSACQTGLGEIKAGEGVYGLQRSFQIAGASSVLTSLWEVSDEGTQDLMTAFYKYWLESGNKQDAFHKAQMEIKEKYKYPYYWGAFVLVGN